MKNITVFAFLVIPFFVSGQEKAREKNTDTYMPSFSELEEGWNTMKPGGETRCALGEDYEFFVYPGDVKKLLIYFNGGGGCWNAELCNPGSQQPFYFKSIEPWQTPLWMEQSWGAAPGILDHTHLENPFLGYTMIHVPYCTGDFHLGQRDVEYTLQNEEGAKEIFTIHHRGLTNVSAVLNWVYQNLEKPESIFISGGSAGGIAAAYYLSVLANYYPGTQVVALADDIGSYRAEEMRTLDYRSWGIPDVLPDQERWGSLWKYGFDITDLIIRGGKDLENGRIFMFDHANDVGQRNWVELVSGKPANLPDLINSNRNAIRESLPDFRYYIAGGINHTVLLTTTFYNYQTDGVQLRDWVASIAAGEEVENVQCINCRRTDFRYGEDDLQIIDHALALLSTPGKWNPQDSFGLCPPDAEEFSLMCALTDGARNANIVMFGSQLMVILPAVIWEVVFISADHLKIEPDFLTPLIYNNRPDATREEIVALLEKARDRIVAGLVIPEND